MRDGIQSDAPNKRRRGDVTVTKRVTQRGGQIQHAIQTINNDEAGFTLGHLASNPPCERAVGDRKACRIDGVLRYGAGCSDAW